MPSTTTTQPPCTFRADVQESGECFIPDTFADDYRALSAALDWARVFNAQQKHVHTYRELDAAAEAAESIAAMCKRFATDARKAAEA